MFACFVEKCIVLSSILLLKNGKIGLKNVFLLWRKMYCTTKYTCLKIVLKERAEIVVVRRFLTYECGCGPHCAVRTAPHTTVRVVVKPTYIQVFSFVFLWAKNSFVDRVFSRWRMGTLFRYITPVLVLLGALKSYLMEFTLSSSWHS